MSFAQKRQDAFHFDTLSQITLGDSQNGRFSRAQFAGEMSSDKAGACSAIGLFKAGTLGSFDLGNS